MTPSDDRALETVLGWPEGGADGELFGEEPADIPDREAALRRLSLEALGLLPWALPPETPSAGARERLLAALPAAGERAAAAPRPASPPSGEGSTALPGGRPAGSWPLTLAAVLAFAALGLAGLAGWLWVELETTRERLSEVRGALVGADAERAELADRLERQEAQLRRRAGMEDVVAAVSTAGVEICPLRPVGDPALHPEAFAVLYMPPGSQEWYLVASNLRPERGGVYQVWLNTPEGPLPVGRIGAGESPALRFALPPAIEARHDLMLSIAITLESETEPAAPGGPMVLFGDEKMTIL